jgi:hypothetical protein
VNINKGFSSSCAWYIFAKKGFNPFTLEKNLPTKIENDKTIEPDFYIYGNYPNPFNPATTITFHLPQEKDVDIVIYNWTGEKVRTLYSGIAFKGVNEIEWNGLNDKNEALTSGIYLYRIRTSDLSLNGKMILLK